ncbi:hypothetical protein [Kribbella kalugense]|nr:hypothetical protein [Kribbella kalugense]
MPDVPALKDDEQRYAYARSGRTRVREDGVVQIGRRDEAVLRRLAEQPDNPIQDTRLRERTVAALENVMAAQVQRMTNPVGSPQSNFRTRVVARESAEGVAAGIGAGALAGGGVGLAAMTPIGKALFVQPVLDLAHDVARFAPEVAAAMQTTPAPWLAAVSVGGSVGSILVSNVLARSGNNVLARPVERAWVQAEGPAISREVGVGAALPELEQNFAARATPLTATAHRLGDELAQHTELDKAHALGLVIGVPPAERAGALVDALVNRNNLPPLAPEDRERAIDRVYRAIGRETSPIPLPNTTSAVTSAFASLASPGATTDAAQDRTTRTALSALPPAGSSTQSQTADGARGNAGGRQSAQQTLNNGRQL